jgi:hypothetical protein
LRLARLALMMRIFSSSPAPLMVYATMSTRPVSDRPKTQASLFLLRVPQIGAVQRLRIREDHGGLFE